MLWVLRAGAEAGPAFDRGEMLAQRCVARGIVGEGIGRASDLRGQYREHRHRRHLAGFDRPTGMAEILIDTANDLRRERPDISAEDIAYVLAIPLNAAARLLD